VVVFSFARLEKGRSHLLKSLLLHQSLRTLTLQLRVEKYVLQLTLFPPSLMTEVCWDPSSLLIVTWKWGVPRHIW